MIVSGNTAESLAAEIAATRVLYNPTCLYIYILRQAAAVAEAVAEAEAVAQVAVSNTRLFFPRCGQL